MPHRIEKIETYPGILAEIIARDFSRTPGNANLHHQSQSQRQFAGSQGLYQRSPRPQRTKMCRKRGKEIAWVFQSALNKKLKMRPVPKIIFVPDANPAQAQQVETILEQLKQSGKD